MERPVWRARFLKFGLPAILLTPAVILAAQWPFEQGRITERLEKALNGRVTSEGFERSFFPRPGCTLRKVRFQRDGEAVTATAERLTIQSSWPNLLTLQKRVAVMKAETLQLTIRTGAGGGNESGGGLAMKTPIDELDLDGAVVAVASGTAGKEAKDPMRFVFHRLRIADLAEGKVMDVSADLDNPHPGGRLSLQGRVGPFVPKQALKAPVQGSFRLTRADLGRYQHIGGSLNGDGKFEGTLESFGVAGKVSVDKFEARREGNAFAVDATYDVVVNGKNGDMQIRDAAVHFAQTYLSFAGTVEGTPGGSGKAIYLTSRSDRARVEDLLLMFTRAPQASMKGPITLRAKIQLPPGKAKFMERLGMDGTFGIENARWTRPRTRMKINELSARARGDKEQVEDGNAATEVVTDVRGAVRLREGTAQLSNVAFKVPGAVANGGGTYNLLNKQVNLRGNITMAADASEAASGIKSVVLKPFNFLFRRKKQKDGATLGFSIVGFYPRPKFTVGMKRDGAA